jgi:acetyl esterase/lipase
MKTLPTAFLVFVLASPLPAQSQKQLADYLKRHPDADANRDGQLSRKEAQKHRRRDPSRGDNLALKSHIPGIDISQAKAPLKTIILKSRDGVDLSFAYRRPVEDGSLPAILFFHGGGGQSNLQGLQNNLRTGAVQTRFLQKGYVTVQSTRRPFWKTKNANQPTGFYDAVADAALVVEKVKSLPGVDPNRVILYGGSGGGILAIVTASKAKVAGVIAGEPATVVPIDPKTGQSASPANYRELMENPQQKYTPERQKEMRAWMKAIDCPVLVLQGKPVGLYKTNFEILIPEMKKLGRDISSSIYPGVTHGFYWGAVKTGATLETVDKIVEDVDAFIRRRAGKESSAPPSRRSSRPSAETARAVRLGRMHVPAFSRGSLPARSASGEDADLNNEML